MLGGVQGFVLGWRDVAERFVEALGVVPGDPFDDRELELGAGAPDAVCDQFGLEGVDEAFCHGVVVGVADRADRREHVVVAKHLLEGVAGVLGGFKWWAERLVLGVVRDGGVHASQGDSRGTGRVVVAGSAVGGVRGGSQAVLARGRGWLVE